MLNEPVNAFSYADKEDDRDLQVEHLAVTLEKKLKRHTAKQQTFIRSVVLSSAVQELWRTYNGDAPVEFNEIWPNLERLLSKVPSSDQVLISFPSFIGFDAVRDERWPILPALRAVCPDYLAIGGDRWDLSILLQAVLVEFECAVARARMQVCKDTERLKGNEHDCDLQGDNTDSEDDDEVNGNLNQSACQVVLVYDESNTYMPNWLSVVEADLESPHAQQPSVEKWQVGGNKWPIVGTKVDRVLDPWSSLETHELHRLALAYKHPKRDWARALVVHQIVVNGGRCSASLTQDRIAKVTINGDNRLEWDFAWHCATLAIESNEPCSLATYDEGAPDTIGYWESTLAAVVRAIWGQGDDFSVGEEDFVNDIINVVATMIANPVTFQWGGHQVQTPVVAAGETWHVDMSGASACLEIIPLSSSGRPVRKAGAVASYAVDSSDEEDVPPVPKKSSSNSLKKTQGKRASKRTKANKRNGHGRRTKSSAGVDA